MPTLDPEKARAAGYTDGEIMAFMRARPDIQLKGGPQGYSGAPDEPLKPLPFYQDPIELATMAPGIASMARLGVMGVKAGVGAIGRGIGGAASRINPEVVGDVAGTLAGERGKSAIRLATRGVQLAQRLAPQAEATTAQTAAEAAPTGADALRAIKPLRANASEAAKLSHRVELELAMKEAKLGAPAQKRLLEAFGHETAAPSVTKTAGKIAGEIKPAPGSAASRAEAAASETATPDVVRGPDAPQHEVQYFSESRGNHINIEDMNQKHIERAVRKLSAKNPKPGSVAHKQLQALIRESIYREGTTGIHVGQQ